MIEVVFALLLIVDNEIKEHIIEIKKNCSKLSKWNSQ